MYLLFFIFIIALGLFIAYRLLWPEMYLKLGRPNFNFKWGKPRLRADVRHDQPITVDAVMDQVEDNNLVQEEPALSKLGSAKIQKIEGLLFEKNKIIDRLSLQLEAEKSHRKEFDNVKNIMDDEIKHLREQLKAFRNYYKEKSDA